MTSRRMFLQATAAGLAGATMLPNLLAADAPAAGGVPRYRVGARHFGGNFESAKRAGMDGVELCIGDAKEKLEISDPALRQKYKDKTKATGVVVSSICIDFLNSRPLATDPLGPSWVEQAIDACKDLDAHAMLLPFFGNAHLLRGKEFKKDETDSLVTRLKALAPKAQDAGVKLGIECSLTAKQYLELFERVGSDAVGAYYDIGNCTGAGFDVPGDIRALKGRLPIFHFKDGNAYLGEGKVKMEPIAEAIKAIDYTGWIVLETSCPSRNVEADCKRNGDYIRKLMGIAA